jgi:hypothetical protein
MKIVEKYLFLFFHFFLNENASGCFESADESEGLVRLWQPGANTQAYDEHSKITDVNSSITLGPEANVVKLFTVVSYEFL